MAEDKVAKELAEHGAGGWPKENTPEEDYEHIRESVEQNLPVINLGGPPGKEYQIAYETWGRFKIVYPDGREEIVQGKTALCSCGRSRNPPFCDQTHQSFMADPNNSDSEVKWEYLTNQERKKIMDGIKINQVKVLERDCLRWNNGDPKDPFSKAYHEARVRNESE